VSSNPSDRCDSTRGSLAERRADGFLIDFVNVIRLGSQRLAHAKHAGRERPLGAAQHAEGRGAKWGRSRPTPSLLSLRRRQKTPPLLASAGAALALVSCTRAKRNNRDDDSVRVTSRPDEPRARIADEGERSKEEAFTHPFTQFPLLSHDPVAVRPYRKSVISPVQPRHVRVQRSAWQRLVS